MTTGFSTLHSKIDRWQNTWQNSKLASMPVARISPEIKMIQNFFTGVDQSFRLFAPTKQNSLNDDPITVTAAQIAKAYIGFRKEKKDFEALTTASIFATLSKEFQSYYAQGLDTKVFKELYQGFKKNIQAFSLYKAFLDNGLIHNHYLDDFNKSFLSLLQVNPQKGLLETLSNLIPNEQTRQESYFQADTDLIDILDSVTEFLGHEAEASDATAVNLIKTLDPNLPSDYLVEGIQDRQQYIQTLNNDPALNKMLEALHSTIGNTPTKALAIKNFLFVIKERPWLKDRFSGIIKNFRQHYKQRLDTLQTLSSVLIEASKYSDANLRTSLNNFEKALKDKVFTSDEDAIGNLGDILVASELHLRNKGDSRPHEERLDPRPFRFDQGPWGKQGNEDKLKVCYQQSKEVMKHFLSRSRSSLSEAGMFMRTSEDGPVFYDEFTQWLNPVYREPSSKQKHRDHNFPGNGTFFSDLNLSPELKEFVAQRAYLIPKNYDDEASLTKDEAIQRSELILQSLSDSTIYKYRGMTVINPNEDDTAFKLTNSQGRNTYGLVFYNDHFANPTTTRALLVPGKYLTKALRNPELTKEKLKPEKLRLHQDVLNLGSLSALNGGLCNARAPYSEPFFAWQNVLGDYPDLNGHSHKYNLIINRFNEYTGPYEMDDSYLGDSYFGMGSGGYLDNSDYDLSQEEMQKFADNGPLILESLQEDHKEIYDVSNRFAIMLRQLDLLESMFSKGAPNTPGTDVSFKADVALGNFANWEKRYQAKPPENEQFRTVLVDADTFKKASKPNWTIRLDPYKGTYETKAEDGSIETYDLSKDPIDRASLLISKMAKASRTLRFYPQMAT